jgi:phasin family protein
MFDKFYGFDADKMTEMFKAADMTKFFENARMPAFDMEALTAAQQKNMEALIEANKAAAAGYQEVFKRQVSLFEETMADLQKQMSEMKMDQLTSEGGQRQMELMKESFDKALANLTELGETAQKANSEAFEIVRGRMQDSVEELKAMTAAKA